MGEEIIDENLPQIVKYIKSKTQEFQKTLNRINQNNKQKKTCHITSYWKLDKEKIVKKARGIQEPWRIRADFFSKTTGSKRQWRDIFQVLKQKTG